MGSVFARGERLYLHYKTIAGKWKQTRSEFKKGEEKAALGYLKELEKQIRAGVEMGERDEGPLTVARYAERWSAARVGQIETWKSEQSLLRNHILPIVIDEAIGQKFGDLLLADVRPRHFAGLMKAARARAWATREGMLAPRTQGNIYKVCHNLFGHAVSVDEYLAANPCVLPRDQRPKRKDKNPAWRATAKFEHVEVEALLSDPRVPEDRRAFYALLFLGGGPRCSEAFAIQLRDYDRSAQPLGRLTYSKSYSRLRQGVKETKTGVTKLAPVHPTLAIVLDSWIADGWARFMGRAPTADDLLFPRGPIPTKDHGFMRGPEALKNLHADCAAIGIRPRRVHDARRSFISLAQDDGADGNVIKRITHVGESDVFSSYTTFSWPRVCAEVAKLKIQIRPLALPPGASPVALLPAPAAETAAQPTPTEETRASPHLGAALGARIPPLAEKDLLAAALRPSGGDGHAGERLDHAGRARTPANFPSRSLRRHCRTMFRTLENSAFGRRGSAELRSVPAAASPGALVTALASPLRGERASTPA